MNGADWEEGPWVEDYEPPSGPPRYVFEGGAPPAPFMPAPTFAPSWPVRPQGGVPTLPDSPLDSVDPRALEGLFNGLSEERLRTMRADDPEIGRIVAVMREMRARAAAAEQEGKKPRAKREKRKLDEEEIRNPVHLS